jgi:formylglycine-generating enzyme required for sulfatase activity
VTDLLAKDGELVYNFVGLLNQPCLQEILMPKIFISYRRADSQYVADTIYDHMCKHFGRENVFLDVGSIPPGVDFRKYLYKQIQEQDVVLVVIGPNWAGIMQERRGQSNDLVRIEIENALMLDKLVIPVLVMGMQTLPDFSTLPESIQDLQWRNQTVIRRHPDLEGDCARLAAGIKEVLGENEPLPSVGAWSPSPLPQQPSPPTQSTQPKRKITDILPTPFEFEWCDIPTGGVEIANHGWFHVPAFQIAKYPVTVAQYEVFMQAGGYQNQEWWTEAGWEARKQSWDWKSKSISWKPTGKSWTQPRYMGDKNYEKFFIPDHPIIGVSWYEAMAFCRWLTTTLNGDGGVSHDLPLRITLPTEQQWQRAAQGDDGRAYPWGKTFDANRCNSSVKSSSSGTTPVTRYPSGASPYSVMDMSGNVWEWCLTEYGTARNDNVYNTNMRVLRGGSGMGYYEDGFRVGYRGGSNPNSRDDGRGFRLSCYF